MESRATVEEGRSSYQVGGRFADEVEGRIRNSSHREPSKISLSPRNPVESGKKGLEGR